MCEKFISFNSISFILLFIYHLLYLLDVNCKLLTRAIRSRSITPDASFSSSPGAADGHLARPGYKSGWTATLPCWLAVDLGMYLNCQAHLFKTNCPSLLTMVLMANLKKLHIIEKKVLLDKGKHQIFPQ